MLALKGYSNGKYVIPLDNREIPRSNAVIITFLDSEDGLNEDPAAGFAKICEKLGAIDTPLSDEFDKILAQRFNINREIEL